MEGVQLNKLANVFLVEDSLSDIILTKAILKTQAIHLKLEVFRDGSEVIERLCKITDKSELPDLMLLDFNLPQVRGEQVLQFMREDVFLSHVPVIMLSGSEATADQDKTEALGARGFMVKPLEVEKLSSALESVDELEFYQENSKWYVSRRQPATT